MRRFDGAVNWPEMYNLFNMISPYLHVAVSKKRAAVLNLLNRSQKRNITKRNSEAPPPDHKLFTAYSGFF